MVLEVTEQRPSGPITAWAGREPCGRPLEQGESEPEPLARALLDAAADGVLLLDGSGRVRDLNAAAVRLFGHGRAQVVGKEAPGLLMPLAARQRWNQALENCRNRGQADGSWQAVEWHGLGQTGREFPAGISLSSVGGDGFVAVIRDLSERKALEDQVRQTRRFEAVGRLASGVAHDFNNLLTVISGYGQVLLSTLPAQDRSRGLAEEIHRAAERATALTRQLLTFSRRQLLQPRTINLNPLVGDLSKMLARMVGDDIELETALDAQPCRLHADPGQLEQILLHLAVQARDSLPKGGRLSIRTGRRAFADRHVHGDGELAPGSYVLLGVSLSAPEGGTPPLESIGEGPCGLAMVRALVRQAAGHCELVAESGGRASLNLYFPALEDKPPSAFQAVGPAEADGKETILLAEDEDSVRRLTLHLLEKSGYRVLAARNGVEALDLAATYPQRIELLVTDVVMPHMGGVQLATRLAAPRPHMKVLYLSGYSDDNVVRHGIVDAGRRFLQKPFSASAFTRKVREVLDQD